MTQFGLMRPTAASSGSSCLECRLGPAVPQPRALLGQDAQDNETHTPERAWVPNGITKPHLPSSDPLGLTAQFKAIATETTQGDTFYHNVDPGTSLA